MYKVMAVCLSDTYLLNLCRLQCDSPLPRLFFYTTSSTCTSLIMVTAVGNAHIVEPSVPGTEISHAGGEKNSAGNISSSIGKLH